LSGKLVIFFVFLLTFSVSAIAGAPLNKVRLQLLWFHQFEFAGYYAAISQGFYRDAGLDVTLIEGGPQTSTIEEVLEGRADFGVSSTGLIKYYLDGKPVLMLAPVFQHSPSVLLSLGTHLSNPSAIAKAGSIGLKPGFEDIDLMSIFIDEGVPLNKLKIATNSLGLEDLLNGKVVAVGAYLSNEPFWLRQHGIAYNVIKPEHYGMDFYAGILFTRDTVNKTRPEIVAAFRTATLKGWEYALGHQDELIGIILANYNTQGKSREQLVYEANVLTDLISPDLIQIGHSNPVRWGHIAKSYIKSGMIKSDFDLSGFLYDPNPPPKDLTWLYLSLLAALIVALVVSGVLFYVRNINIKLKLAKEAVDQLLSDQSQFVAMLSHELRAPLAVIDSALQVLYLNLKGNDKAESVIRRISRGVNRLVDFIDSYLTQDRIDSEFTALQLSRVNIKELAAWAKADAELAYPNRTIATEIDPALVVIDGDQQLLRVLISNLLSNAVKYSPEGSVVTLRFILKGSQCCIEVIDQGFGIPADELSFVFRKYVRGEAALKTPGAGLGLSLVSRIVKLHGGIVRVESRVGEGSQFIVELPVKSSNLQYQVS